MDGEDTARLIYLSLLGGAVVMWFFAQNRNSLGKLTQQAVVWGLIFVGVIAAVGLWGDIRRTVADVPGATLERDGRIELPRARDGHYYLTAKVNGVPVTFLVDTGASDIVMTMADAQAVGIKTDNLVFFGRAMTANGVVRTAPVRLDHLQVGSLQDQNIPAVVNQGDQKQSLLGMRYLQVYSSIEFKGGKLMVLTR